MAVCSNCDIDGKYYVGSIGTEILVDVCIDITSATVTDLLVEKPDGTIATWGGTVYEITKIRHVVEAGDFDQAGEYYVQAYVEMPGWSGYGTTTSFRVMAAFN
jgi:hypothetical protein